MSKTLSHLTPFQRRQLAKVIHKIANASGAEKIYCYGRRLAVTHRWSPFMANDNNIQTAFAESYDLVLVMPAHEQRTKPAIHATLNAKTVAPLAVTCLIFYWQETTDLLKNGDHFLRHLQSKGARLHSSSKKRLPKAPFSLTSEADAAEAETTWPHWMDKAAESMAFAKEYLAKRKYRLAAYMLYSAACFICNALVRSHTGYRPCTAQLDQLLLLCDNFCTIRKTLFPANTPEEIELLELLNNARHVLDDNDPCKVTKDTCSILLRRVEKLRQQAHACYNEKKQAAAVDDMGPLAVDNNGLLKPFNP